MVWKKLKSRKLFSHTRLSVYEDDVELPGGHRTKYIHLGKMPDAALVIATNNDCKILMQSEYSYPPNVILLQFPGGLLEKKETPQQGAAREFAEEAGLKGHLNKIGWFYTDNRRKSQKLHVFVAKNLKKAYGNKDIEEQFEDHWLSEDDINTLIREGKITNYTALAAWAIYANRVR